MKKSILIVSLLLLLTGCVENSYGKRNLNDLVDTIRINDYFIGDNQYWKVCWKHQDRIWDREEGYQVSDYPRLPVTHVSDSYDYDYHVYQVEDGSYEMKIKLTCDFDVTVSPTAFFHPKEEMSFDGGTIYFKMNIEEKEGTYKLKGMKAYKQEF